MAGRCDVLHDHLLHARDVFRRMDVVQAEVVAFADVGHDRHRAFVEAQSFAQHAAARRLQHRRLHMRMREHITRALRAAAVAAVGLAATDIHAIGIGHAHAQAAGREHMCDQPRRGGLAVDAGDGDHRDAAVVALLEHQLHHCFADVAPLAVGRIQVHAQAGRGIHLDHAAVLLFQRAHDAFADDIHAAYMQAHHRGRIDGARRGFRVYVVSHIGRAAAGRQVRVIAQHDATAFLRHRVRLQALVRQAGHRDVIETDLGQRGRMAIAATRIGVHHIDQLLDGALAVADDVRRVASRGRDQSVADHQQAVVAAGEKFLDQYRAFAARCLGR